jgi:hypothetical protein
MGTDDAARHPADDGLPLRTDRRAWPAAVALVSAQALGVGDVDAGDLVGDADPMAVATCCAQIAARLLRTGWPAQEAEQLRELGAWAARGG